ncbi:hypothetical protein MMC30_003699 [Trapelia coarctata]|nr:hypothetical protein [Trapelia coarctata]
MKSISRVSALIFYLSLTIPTHAFPKKAKGKDATVQGGNQATTTFTFNKDQFGNNDVINLQASTGQQGGQTQAGKRAIYERGPEGWKLYVRDAYPEAYAEAEAYAFLNGGSAKGGSSNTNGGNNANNKNTLSNDKFNGNGQTFNLGSSISQVGGNTVGGNGGRNTGKGGAGGSLSVPVSLPMPVRRWLHTDPEVYLYERNAYPDPFPEPEPFLNGGGAKGGDSITKGGNNVKNDNTLKNNKFTGNGQTFNMGSSSSQVGGNTVGGKGGANSGSGGQGGSLSVPVSMPFPVRRGLDIRDADPEAYDFAERDAYPKAYAEQYDVFEREAYPDPYAEAEAEAEADIYAHDTYFYGESF